MPINYKINKEQRLISAVGSGVITAKDVIDHLESLASDEKYIAPMKKIVDYRNIENIIISQDEATIIASRKKEYIKSFAGEKCAFVSPGDLTFGKSRVHQALVDSADINTHVFRTMEEAKEWLNV